MENKIVMISIERLHQHPKNPRKNIGDVTELAESIAKSGILQNLTVVPWVSELTGSTEEGEYTVVIGHRRLAAAKKAGLKELPCIVKKMSPAEQLATMLAENVQRNDLTPIEQAEGIQMMFDIGETVSDVVQKTGLSESTVRRRAKLLELDRDKLHQTEGRGATLADYEKLNQIEDLDKRNEVLETIGTNNFNMEFEKAIDSQRREKNKIKLCELLDTFAKKVDSTTGCEYMRGWNYDRDIKVEVPKDAENEEYVYYVDSYYVYLYRKVKAKNNTDSPKTSKKEKEEQEKRQRESERKESLKKLAEDAYNLRKKFIAEFNPAPRHGKEIKRFLWSMLVFCEPGWLDTSDVDSVCGTSFAGLDTFEELSSASDEYFENNPEKAMLQAAYVLSGDDEQKYIDTWDGTHDEDSETDKLYECLERLGYQMSDDEKKLQDGTHELFKKE